MYAAIWRRVPCQVQQLEPQRQRSQQPHWQPQPQVAVVSPAAVPLQPQVAVDVPATVPVESEHAVTNSGSVMPPAQPQLRS